MHRFDPSIISFCEGICRKNVFGVIIGNCKQAVILTALCLFGVYPLCCLNIKTFALSCCYKVYLSVCEFSDYILFSNFLLSLLQ